ncbi:uncharacterized protein LOC121253491 [Juglans microcarpa x Juglans regia]|uniref:uncharacterized protein LOC121253491 n=1 Tax=Juglans microcarpa x Juglans regia TaxID=2249226 RepID=UPI001B7D97CD|nr:uncharacterized protein LOC121253491 [Juglans microcarpa x Juglans regia]
MIDAASGGALVDKIPETARNLIANMAANSQQFGTRLDLPSKHVNEEPIEQVNAAGGFPGQPQRKYDPYSNTYNPGWRDHPNLSYENSQVNQPTTQNSPSYQQYKQPYPPRQQLGQTSNTGNEGQYSKVRQSDGPDGNCNYGKEVEILVKAALASLKQEKEKNVVANGNVPNDDDVSKCKFPLISDYKPVPHFPQALVESRKDEQNKDLYETFCRCEVNIPLLDAIKQVSRYAKFFKELCTTKKRQKLKRCENVRVGENVSAVIQRKLPTKCKDPSIFTIPCTIGNTRFEKAMIDLGSSINVMSYSIYASLKLGPLNKTGVVIQLADRSNAYPKGVVEVVLVQINDLVFPTDFYVLDMENDDQTAPILLGRPFLKTSMTKIDVHSGTFTMEFDGEIIKFNIYDAMKYPGDDNSVYSIDVIDSLAQEVFELDGKYGLEVAISKHLEKENEELALSTDCRKLLQH